MPVKRMPEAWPICKKCRKSLDGASECIKGPARGAPGPSSCLLWKELNVQDFIKPNLLLPHPHHQQLSLELPLPFWGIPGSSGSPAGAEGRAEPSPQQELSCALLGWALWPHWDIPWGGWLRLLLSQPGESARMGFEIHEEAALGEVEVVVDCREASKQLLALGVEQPHLRLVPLQWCGTHTRLT